MKKEEFIDEEIVKSRRRELKKNYVDTYTGMYAGDFLVNFIESRLFNEQIKIRLPEKFTLMTPENARKKYPAENRPELIYANYQESVNFTFSLFHQRASMEQIINSVRRYQVLIQKYRQDIEILNTGDLKDEKISYGWFTFKNSALDEIVFNMLAIVGLKKSLLLCMFNCIYGERNDWEEIMSQTVRTIREEE